MALTNFPSGGIQPSPTNPDYQSFLIDFSDEEAVTLAFAGQVDTGGTEGRPSSGIMWPRRLG